MESEDDVNKKCLYKFSMVDGNCFSLFMSSTDLEDLENENVISITTRESNKKSIDSIIFMKHIVSIKKEDK